jgi:hypothetical protein
MAASYFGKKAPYGFVMEVTLLFVFILWLRQKRVTAAMYAMIRHENAVAMFLAGAVMNT